VNILQTDEEGDAGNLNLIAGVIKAEDEVKMNRMVFRVSRGRAIPSFYNMDMDKVQLIK